MSAGEEIPARIDVGWGLGITVMPSGIRIEEVGNSPAWLVSADLLRRPDQSLLTRSFLAHCA